MSVLIVDVDQQSKKVESFRDQVAQILPDPSVLVPSTDVAASDNKWRNAAICLSEFVKSDKQFWSPRKQYNSVFYVWGDYSSMNVDKVSNFLNHLNNNLIILPTFSSVAASPNWIFGSIAAMIKWSTAIDYIKAGVELDRSPVNCYLQKEVWLMKRLNLDVYAIEASLC